MTEPLVEVRDLHVTYKSSKRREPVRAVRGVSLAIPRGTTLGLVGESGSGKSTLGAAILGLVPASQGSIHFDGQDITSIGRSGRRALGSRMRVVFQDPFGSMNPMRTVGDTVAEGLVGQAWTRVAVQAAVGRVLEDVGLDASAAARYPKNFSGGQRQRIAIARALAVDPDFLVCDEPVSALDLSVQAQILNLLGALQRERQLTMLFVSHDLSVVRHVSDSIAVMNQGEIVERGPADDVATNPTHPYTQLLMAASPVPDPAAQAENRARRLALAPVGRDVDESRT
jgi:ABC-type oligopeptide transport system ATPase subunit